MTNADDMALWKKPVFVNDLARAHASAINEIAVVLGINSIWIDEGHGGSFPGAVAKDGTREADLVLMLSNKIEAFTTVPEQDGSSGFVLHTVTIGDTFWQLALEYETTVEAIQAANPGVDPNF